MEFTLDYNKILEDEKFDGYYVYETSRMDLKANDIIEIYHKQWQIEENFKTLKNALKIDLFVPKQISTLKVILYLTLLH
ncbi:transposase [Mycoplasma phocimorsus]|uniref:transposase n=1 Tax=Mycoplasma phocimorsus TaxID=3045839 RepID=UPI0032206424